MSERHTVKGRLATINTSADALTMYNIPLGFLGFESQRLGAMMKLWEKYFIHRARFWFVSSVSDDTDGEIVIGLDTDSEDIAPATMEEVMSWHYSVSAPLKQSRVLLDFRNERLIDGMYISPLLYTSPEADEPRFTNFGQLIVMTDGTPAAGAAGHIEYEIDVTFVTPDVMTPPDEGTELDAAIYKIAPPTESLAWQQPAGFALGDSAAPGDARLDWYKDDGGWAVEDLPYAALVEGIIKSIADGLSLEDDKGRPVTPGTRVFARCIRYILDAAGPDIAATASSIIGQLSLDPSGTKPLRWKGTGPVLFSLLKMFTP